MATRRFRSPPREREASLNVQKHNRLFILGSKSSTEEEFREAFSKFGTVTDIWIVKDRKTDESKGVTYVTMSKTSEACLALDDMNGRIMEGQSKPIKVMIAADREKGNHREDNEEERLLRIFIKVSKSTTEDELDVYFRKYGELDYVSIIKDKESGLSKGLAYVKYFKCYHAALAVEEADSQYKAVFAEKKQKPGGFAPYNNRDRDYNSGSRSRYNSSSSSMDIREDYGQSSRGAGIMGMYANVPHNNEVNLEAMVSTSASQEQIYGLFDLVPGLQFCEFDRNTGMAQVQYSSPQCASYACQKLNGFEYPPGFRISVRFPPAEASYSQYGAINSWPNRGGQFGQETAVTEISQSLQSLAANPGVQGNEMLQTLVDTMSKATALLQNRADVMSTPSVEMSSNEDAVRTNYCNIVLPPKQPVCSIDTPVEERLFIVSQTSAFPDKIMTDLFCRFGSLIDAHFISGRNYGYAKYGSKESATNAISALHGQEVCGMRLKVLLADPPKYSDGGDSSAKRPRNS